MYLIPVPALADNYLWLLHDSKHAPVVNPAGAGTVRAIQNRQDLDLESILVTHLRTGHARPTSLTQKHTWNRLRLPFTYRPDNQKLAANCCIN
jgi:hydroxyacylglutathione hydrolase